jgi:hypothetical protein
MKRLALLVVLVTLIAAPGAQAATNPFAGPWRATDIADNSALALTISGGKTTTINYIDHSAPGTCAGALTVVFEATLTGSIDIGAGTLTGTFRKAHCGRKNLDLGGLPTIIWTLNPDGTLTDTLGDTWSRP